MGEDNRHTTKMSLLGFTRHRRLQLDWHPLEYPQCSFLSSAFVVLHFLFEPAVKPSETSPRLVSRTPPTRTFLPSVPSCWLAPSQGTCTSELIRSTDRAQPKWCPAVCTLVGCGCEYQWLQYSIYQSLQAALPACYFSGFDECLARFDMDHRI